MRACVLCSVFWRVASLKSGQKWWWSCVVEIVNVIIFGICTRFKTFRTVRRGNYTRSGARQERLAHAVMINWWGRRHVGMRVCVGKLCEQDRVRQWRSSRGISRQELKGCWQSAWNAQVARQGGFVWNWSFCVITQEQICNENWWHSSGEMHYFAKLCM